MLPDRGRNGRESRIFATPVSRGRVLRRRVIGVHTAWTTVGDGEFFCPGCGGDRNYQRRTGRRRFVLLGVPVLPRGTAGPIVECAACGDHFGTDVLGHPTTTRLSAMVRDAVHTVVLGDPRRRRHLVALRRSTRPSARCAAPDSTTAREEQLVALVDALAADTGRATVPGLRRPVWP